MELASHRVVIIPRLSPSTIRKMVYAPKSSHSPSFLFFCSISIRLTNYNLRTLPMYPVAVPSTWSSASNVVVTR